MSKNITSILPNIGLGDIKFGLNRNQVKEILGEPDEIDAFAYDEETQGDLTESWHYDEMELSCSFDESEDWKMVNISVSSIIYILNGEPVIGLSKENLITLIDNANLGEIEEDEENQVITVIDSQVNFWFDEEGVSEIQWSVNWDEDDNPIWPN